MDKLERVPDETLSLIDGEAVLYTGAQLNAPFGTINADRMAVQYHRGGSDDVLVFVHEGKRRVMKVRLLMSISTPSPIVDASVSWRSEVEEIPDRDERKRLLVLYDRFSKSSFRE